VLTSAGTPSSATLDGLKLQAAPAGRPAVQLPGLEITPGLDTIEFVKLTVPVKPVVGVRVMTEVAVCPAGTLSAVVMKVAVPVPAGGMFSWTLPKLSGVVDPVTSVEKLTPPSAVVGVTATV